MNGFVALVTDQRFISHPSVCYMCRMCIPNTWKRGTKPLCCWDAILLPFPPILLHLTLPNGGCACALTFAEIIFLASYAVELHKCYCANYITPHAWYLKTLPPIDLFRQEEKLAKEKLRVDSFETYAFSFRTCLLECFYCFKATEK